MVGNAIRKLDVETQVRNDSQFLTALNREIRYLFFCLESHTFVVSKKQMFCCDSASYSLPFLNDNLMIGR